jgi:hypothetical protein
VGGMSGSDTVPTVLTGVSDRTALRDLDGLVEAGVFTRASGGRQARYSLRGI